MIIPINDKYRISTDRLNWRIDKFNNVKQSKKYPDGIYWAPQFYFTTLQNALRYLVELEIRESNCVGLLEAIRLAENLASRYSRLLEGVTEEIKHPRRTA